MAITVLTGRTQAAAVNYNYTTSGSTDWSSVPNSTYFYDLVDKLPHYKNPSGTVLEVFSESPPTDNYVTGGTYSFGTITLDRQNGSVTITGLTTGYTLTSSAISSTLGYTPLSAYTDNYVTGGTYSSGTLTLNRQNGSVIIGGFSSTDTFVTGFTYSNNNLTISRNQGQPSLTVNVSTMTGLTVNGNLSTTTFRMTTSPVNGYVLTSDASGNGTWSNLSTAYTGNTSASCITDLWVTNVHGCSPITIHDQVQSFGSSATGTTSFAFGNNVKAYGDYSHAEGQSTTASGLSSHAEGDGTTAQGDFSHSEGNNTTAIGTWSHSQNRGTKALGDYSHAEGQFTRASGATSHAEGRSTTASGSVSHAEGAYTIASGVSSHAEGQYTTALGDSSHAEGDNTTAIGDYSHAEGSGTTASNNTSHAEGRLTRSQGDASHAEGLSTIAQGNYSHAEGERTSAGGQSSHAEGGFTSAGGNYSHAEGYDTIASGLYSHAEGISNIASGRASHVEGGITSSVLSGIQVFANSATTFSAHAEGAGTLASGVASHSEGQLTIASGRASHAEGFNTTAIGQSSHAEGDSTTAFGIRSHAEGFNTTANGGYSHTEGRETTAGGDYSHVGGRSNNSDGNYNVVYGYINNVLSTSDHNSVLGGTVNTIFSTASGNNTILCGNNNQITDGTLHVIFGNGAYITGSSYNYAFGQGPITRSDINLGTKQVIFGDGTASTGSAGKKNTILFDLFNGNGYWDGTADVGPADYAEYFEWNDGNTLNEDRVGYFVSLMDNSDKIEKGDTNIVGIVSAKPALVGDSAFHGWKDMYLTDEWGRNLTEEYDEYQVKEEYTNEDGELKEKSVSIYIDKNGLVYSETPNLINYSGTIYNGDIENKTFVSKLVEKKINPNYNPNQSYVSRKDRPEWSAIGLLGKLRVRTAEQITGSTISCDVNGMAINGSDYHVLETLKEYDGNYGIIKILFK